MLKRNKKNLVVLAYASNECYTKLVRLGSLESEAANMNSVDVKDLKIDIEKMVWSFCKWEYPIGEGRRGLGEFNNFRWGIIGIYNISSYEHVRRLVSDAQEAVKTPEHGYASAD